MLDLNLIRQKPGYVKKMLQRKGFEFNVEEFLSLDKERRKLISEIENLRHLQKTLSKKRPLPLEKLKEIKSKIKSLEKILEEKERKFKKVLYSLPNLPLEEVPEGKDETENVVVKEVGRRPEFNFQIKDHLELGEKFSLIDVKRAGKIAGSRFCYLKNEAVLMEFSLLNFVFDFLTKEKNLKKIIQKNKIEVPPKPFIPILPPVMIKPEMMKGMGYLLRAPEEGYFIEKDNLYLVGTAEHSIGPMHAGEILREKDLPLRYLGFSTCFRREAGSWGKDTRGIFRVHQFDKIEMFSFVRPEDSKNEHKFLLAIEETLVQKLNLPYRVVQICSGDLSDPSAASFDIECWIPSQKRYRETHSCSNCTDFQARRLNIRFRREKTGKVEYVHTLNATAFAIGRTLIAIFENYQTKEGKIKIPKILQKYLNKKEIG